MKVKTVIENKLPKKRIKKNKNKLIIAVLMLVELLFNQILPFSLGVYFGLTNSMWLLAIFIFLIFFELRITIDKKSDIKIKILRGI